MSVRSEDRDEWIDMRADALFAEYLHDDEKIAEARESVGGTFDEPFYPELEAALDRLHGTESESLLGSDVLVDLYRMARTFRTARDARLKEMAEDDAEDEWIQAGYDKGEELAWDRAA